MPPISDKLRSSAYRSTMKRPLPDWWPAAQVVAAAGLVVGFFVVALVQFGNSDTTALSDTTTAAYDAEVIYNPDTPPVPPQDVVTQPEQTATEEPTPDSTPDSTPGSTPSVAPEPGAADTSYSSLPTTIDAQSASIELVDGGTKAVPIGAWIATRDYVVATYGGSQIAGAALRSGSTVAYTFVVSLTGAAAAYNVQVVAVQQANGAWVAN
jgi:hypothetical protein